MRLRRLLLLLSATIIPAGGRTALRYVLGDFSGEDLLPLERADDKLRLKIRGNWSSHLSAEQSFRVGVRVVVADGSSAIEDAGIAGISVENNITTM